MKPKATKGTALKTKILRRVSADGGADDLDAAADAVADAANPDDGVALHALAVVTPAILPFVELAAVHARHALVAELVGTEMNVTPVADVGDARRATPAAAATAARRIMAATRTRR
jgi:hypothetical protein